jgi:hypothetical protein
MSANLSRVQDVRIADGVVVVEDGGEAFLLHTASRRYFRMNETGLEVWRALAAEEEPAAALQARYPSVGADVLDRDVEAICERLLSAGLLHRSQP